MKNKNSVFMKFMKNAKQNPVAMLLMTLVFILLFVYSLTLIYPFVWAFFNSLKSNPEYWENTMSLPKDWLFSNYIIAFTDVQAKTTNPFKTANMIEMLINSIWYTAGGTFLGVLGSTMVAYTVARYDFFGKRLIYGLAVFVMIIPIVGSLPASYKLVYSLGIANSPLYLIATVGAFGMPFFVMSAFFGNVSWAYAEAAFIEGASNFRVFVDIMLPLAKPGFITMFITSAISRWNDYLTPMLYLKDFPTLSAGLFDFQHSSRVASRMPVYFSAMLLMTLPIIAVFIGFQETIMNNMSIGGLKG